MNKSLISMRQNWQTDLTRTNELITSLSEQLEGQKQKREQLKGAIFAMDATLKSLAEEEKATPPAAPADAGPKAPEEKAETKAESSEEPKAEAAPQAKEA